MLPSFVVLMVRTRSSKARAASNVRKGYSLSTDIKVGPAIKKSRLDTKKNGVAKNGIQDWKDTYRLFQVLRKDRTAPVDHDGSSVLGEKGAHFGYQTLIAFFD